MKNKATICLLVSALLIVAFVAAFHHWSWADFRRSRLKQLGDAKEVRLEATLTNTDSQEAIELWCKLSRQRINSIRKWLQPARREQHPLKWEVVGALHISDKADKQIEWLILHISKTELGLRININEYYRGLPVKEWTALIEECDRVTQKANAIGREKSDLSPVKRGGMP